MFWYIVILVILLVICLLPLVLNSQRKAMGRKAREAAPGEFARLSAGLTHYRWIGPTRGPVAVMIHGLNTSSPVWEDTAAIMADVGYRVLVYDLYNRGYSTNVDGPHDIDLYLTQLDELLTDQDLDAGLTLVGYSMGAMVATEFAATEPHRMKQLVMLTPLGIISNESRMSRFMRKTPVLGDWLNGTWGNIRLHRQILRDRLGTRKPHIRAARMMELNRQGYLRGVLASRRGIMQHGQERQHRAINRDAIPTIAIWGDYDKVVPLAALGQLTQWNRKAIHEVIPNAGHELLYTHTDEVSELLRRMLRETAA